MLKLKRLPQALDLVTIAGIETGQGILHDRRILAAETLLDELRELGNVEIKHARNQPERVNILALVAPRAADRFDGERRDRHSDVMIRLEQIVVRLHMVGVVKHDAASFEGTN